MAEIAEKMFEDARRHYQAGNLVDAERICRRLLKLDPRHADSLHLLGLMAYRTGRNGKAVDWLRQAIRLKGDVASFHNSLGSALLAQGKHAPAAACYRRTLILNPDHAQAHNNLGFTLQAQGKLAESVACFERAVAAKPDFVEAHYKLGRSLQDLERYHEAAACYVRTIALDPRHAGAYNNLGYLRYVEGKLDDAVDEYRRALSIDPNYADAYNNLGYALHDQGKYAQAIVSFERAISIQPDYAEAINNLGNVVKDLGDPERAVTLYDRALALKPDYAQAHFNRADIKTFSRADPSLHDLENLAARAGDLPAKQAPYVHYALAKALEDIADYAASFEQIVKGSALRRGQIVYDEVGTRAFFHRLAAAFDAEAIDRLQGRGCASSLPIFIAGMPRSGTTLIEQILSGHPLVHAAGELTVLDAVAADAFRADGAHPGYPECLRGIDDDTLARLGDAYIGRLPKRSDLKARVTDKLPGNFINIGLIHLALPNARIIHVVRDAADTCMSCFSKLFREGQEFSYDLAELGRYYRYYSQLMDHWRSVLPQGAMLEVRYEDVVDDLEGQSRRITDYCGLPWDDRCLSFHETERAVGTASALQVRRPIYRSSLQRWRRFAAYLEPLLRELG